MKIIFDLEANAEYIYLKAIKKGEVKSTISFGNINLDLSQDEKILGIEIIY